MAEHGIAGKVLGVAWDGSGYGPDGTIWGGEFLLVDDDGYRRVAHLRTFRLPGGDRAVKEPRRSAIGLLYELFGGRLLQMVELGPVASFDGSECEVLVRMLERAVHSPLTSSAGRLFDGVAALLNLHLFNEFEGQAAMSLEYLCDGSADRTYPFILRGGDQEGCAIIDWEPMVRGVLDDLESESPRTIAGRFHGTLTEIIAAVAGETDLETVVLSGGCFQNRVLLESTARKLRNMGKEAVWHRRVPANDGGIALGQLAVAAMLAGKAGPRL